MSQYLITWKSRPDCLAGASYVRQSNSIAEVTEQALAEIREAYPAGVVVEVVEYSDWPREVEA